MSEPAAEVVEQETTDDLEQDANEQADEELTPDEEPEPDPDPEPEPEPEQPANLHTEEWWEKAWSKSEAENRRHADRVSAIFEEESQEFAQCPMCMTGPAGWLTGNQFSDDHRTLIVAALGMDDPSSYEPMRGAVVCDTCKGRGKVKTPSKVAGYQTLMCPDCQQSDPSGRKFATGWRYVPGPHDPARPEFQTVSVTPTEIVSSQSAEPAPAQSEAQVIDMPYDAWSRPVGHPHFGIPPADVGV